MERKSIPWVEALCIVSFDNSFGPVVTESFPNSVLAKEDLHTVATLAFPESNGVTQAAHNFFFRFRLIPSEESKEEQRFLFGFSHYTVQKDAANPRGYTQQALVLLTQLYFTTFYSQLASALPPSPEFLKEFYDETLKWSRAIPGGKFTFEVQGKSFSVLRHVI